MKPTALIHIGAEKSGSTSIQDFLVINKAELLKRGYYIPTFLGASNHRVLPFLVYNTTREDEFTIKNNLAPGSRRRTKLRDITQRNLMILAKRYADKRWIISSEHIHSRLTTADEITRFKELLDATFSSYSFIFYARKPIDLAVSLFSTAIKDGHYLTDLPSASHPYWSYLCDYKSSITVWQKIFSDSVISVRIFDSSQFSSGTLIGDFCNALNIDRHDSLAMPVRMNQSLSINSLRLLNGLNKARGNNSLSVIYAGSPHQKLMVSLFDQLFPNENSSFVPSPAQISDYDNLFSNSNQWILENFSSLDKNHWAASSNNSIQNVNTSSLQLTEVESQLLEIISILVLKLSSNSPVSLASNFISRFKTRISKLLPIFYHNSY